MSFSHISLASLLALASFAVSAAGLEVSDPWVRAVPPGQPNSAVFMELRNTSDAPRALVEAHSPVAETVELHTHVAENGMMRMRRIERMEVAPGENLELAPGGLHVMLIGLKSQLVPGGEVELKLIDDQGDAIAVSAPVRALLTPPMPMQHMHH